MAPALLLDVEPIGAGTLCCDEDEELETVCIVDEDEKSVVDAGDDESVEDNESVADTVGVQHSHFKKQRQLA